MKCEKYDHKRIEKKWQDRWEEAGVYHASNDFTKPKYYALVEFRIPPVRDCTWAIHARTRLSILCKKAQNAGI